jgi:hypothetical protein
MKATKPVVKRARTVEEIEKAIAERDRQNEADRQELIKAKAQEVVAESEKTIFVYLDSVRKNPPDKLKAIISASCSSYNTNLATLRSKFRKDRDDLQHLCVTGCLDAYRKQVGESAATPENFLKLLGEVCPDVKIKFEKAEAKSAKTKAEAEKVKNKTAQKDEAENKAPQNINVPPPPAINKDGN